MEQQNLALFLEFYDTHYDKIHKHIFYRTGCNREVADDLTSEVFIKAFEHLRKFESRSSIKTWVYRIAQNHIIDYYRTRRESVPLESIAELHEPGKFTDDIAAKHETEKLLVTLKQLSKRDQQLITLKYLDQLETDEIAQILKMSANHVYVGLHRAIHKLQSLI